MTDRMVRLGPRQAERRAQTWRRLHETENLLARLDAALAVRRAGPGDELLHDACRVLAPLVARSPGADVQVSIGPDHRTAVRMRVEDGELSVHLVRCDAPAGLAATQVIPSSQHAAAAVATLLWAGGLDDEDDRTDPHPAPEA